MLHIRIFNLWDLLCSSFLHSWCSATKQSHQPPWLLLLFFISSRILKSKEQTRLFHIKLILPLKLEVSLKPYLKGTVDVRSSIMNPRCRKEAIWRFLLTSSRLLVQAGWLRSWASPTIKMPRFFMHYWIMEVWLNRKVFPWAHRHKIRWKLKSTIVIVFNQQIPGSLLIISSLTLEMSSSVWQNKNWNSWGFIKKVSGQ